MEWRQNLDMFFENKYNIQHQGWRKLEIIGGHKKWKPPWVTTVPPGLPHLVKLGGGGPPRSGGPVHMLLLGCEWWISLKENSKTHLTITIGSSFLSRCHCCQQGGVKTASDSFYPKIVFDLCPLITTANLEHTVASIQNRWFPHLCYKMTHFE